MWRFWHSSVRPLLGLAVRIALPLGAAGVAALFTCRAAFWGAWGGGSGAALVAGLVAGSLLAGRRFRFRARERYRSGWLAAALTALPLAFGLLAIAGTGLALLTPLAILPVVNYGLPALLAEFAAALALGVLISRRRAAIARRYPPQPPQILP